MGLSFILGRAGMGKTRFCMDEIRAALQQSRNGPGLFMLVPEQASFHVTRTLLKHSGNGAYFRLEALSFRHLAYRVLNERGCLALNPIGGLERLLLMRSLLMRNRDKLRHYGRLWERPSLAGELLRFISELSNHRQTPRSLLETSSELASQALADKLADLAMLWKDYQDELEGKALDPDSTLANLIENLEQCDWLAGSRFWVDGFSSFSPEETAVLEALSRHVESLKISLCLNPGDIPKSIEELDPTRLFYPTEETYLQLQSLPGWCPKDDIVLQADSAPRFKQSAELGLLEEALIGGDWNSLADTEQASSIEIREAANPTAEIEAVAARILHLVRDEGFSFHHIAVTTRGMGNYAELVRSVFTDAGIPHFLDQRQSIRSHPLMELIVNAQDTALQRSRKALIDLIKTGLCGLEQTQCDLLENAFLANGIDGGNYGVEIWPEYGQPLKDSLLKLRDRYIGNSEIGVVDFCSAVFEFLSELDIRQTLHSWIERAKAEGRGEEAERHRQAWESMLGLLEQMTSGFGPELLPARQWTELLECGLSELEWALIPPALDAVLVSSIERSRHPEIRALFFIGMQEGVLPKKPSYRGILSDNEREALEERDFHVAPSASRALAEESYLAYIALTRASERLYLSYPACDSSGKKNIPSRWIDAIPRDICTAPINRDILGPRYRLAHCLTELSTSTNSGSALSEVATLLDNAATSEACSSALASLWYANTASLSDGIHEQLYGKQWHSSATQMEDYAKCPFKFFAARRLRLREREEYRLDPIETGRLAHALLETYGKRVIERGGAWDTLSNEELGAGLEQTLEELAALDQSGNLWLKVARNHQQLRALAMRLRPILAFMASESQTTKFRTRHAEWAFNWDSELLLAIPYQGGEVMIQGILDRIDVLDSDDEPRLRIIDYKSSAKSINSRLAEEGIDAQLPIYMLAAERLYGEGEVSGAFYCSLASKLGKVPPSREINASSTASTKLRGIIHSDDAVLFDPQLQPGEVSNYVGLSLKKDGEPTKRSDIWYDEDISTLLTSVENTLASNAASIAQGKIEPAPSRIDSMGRKPACMQCEFLSVCRYDFYNPDELEAENGEDEE
jgi:ATP-dependent helicase/nuclease subunit B